MSNDIYPAQVKGLTYTVLKTPEFGTIVQKAPNGYELRVSQMVNPLWHFALTYDYLYDTYPSANNTKAYYPYTDLSTLLGFFMQHQGQWDDFLFNDPTDNSVGPAILTTAWTAKTRFGVNMGVLDSGNHWQKCTTAGTTGSSVPTFNHSGSTTTDGTVVWTDMGAGYSGGFPNLFAQLPLVNDGAGNYYSPIQRNVGGLFSEDITDLQGSISVYANAVAKTAGGGSPDYTIQGPGLALPGYSFMGLYLAWTAPPTGPITAAFNFYFRVRFEGDTQDFENWAGGLWTIGGSTSKNGSGQLKLMTSRPAEGGDVSIPGVLPAPSFTPPVMYVATTRSVSTASPITGGGALSSDLTLGISDFVGDSGSGGTAGIVPAPASGDAAANKFLKADGTWTTPSGTGLGSVTSVAITGTADQTVSGSPVTGAGTISITDVNQAAGKFKAGPATGSPATPTYRSIAQSDLPVMTGDTGSGGAKGAVPAPGSGDAAANKYLKADGTWALLTALNPTLNIGTPSFTGGKAIIAASAGVFDNNNDHSTIASTLGTEATSVWDVQQRIHPISGFDNFHRESAVIAGAVNPASSTNTETNALSAMVVNESGVGNTVACSMFSIGAASGAKCFGLNTLVRDYDREDFTLHYPCHVLNEMDYSIADLGTTCEGININIDWVNGKPTPTSSCIRSQRVAGTYSAYWDFSFISDDHAALVGLYLARQAETPSHTVVSGGTDPNDSQFIQFASGSGGGFSYSKMWVDNTGTFVFDAGSAGHQFKVSNTGKATVNGDLAITGTPTGFPYDVDYSVAGAPAGSATVPLKKFTRAVSFLSNFGGSQGTCETNPTSTATYTVQKNGSTVGTVAISTGGAFTFATSGGAAVSFAIGDVLTVITPATDPTLAGVSFTLAGKL